MKSRWTVRGFFPVWIAEVLQLVKVKQKKGRGDNGVEEGEVEESTAREM